MGRKSKMLLGLMLCLGLLISGLPALAAGSGLTVRASTGSMDKYPGVKFGEPFMIKVSIKNQSSHKYQIGDYMRVLFDDDPSSWNQFAMAASGPAKPKARNIRALVYGSGCGTIAQLAKDKSAMLLNFGGNDVINDRTITKAKQFSKWWPGSVATKSSQSITWPVFWYSKTTDSPQFLASPVFSRKGKSYVFWVPFDNKPGREIPFTSKALKKIILSASEPSGLRSAAARWLMQLNRKNEKTLLAVCQNADTPRDVANRSVQALMIWGSQRAIDDFYKLWKSRKLNPALDDKDTHYYFTWSAHDKDKKYSKPVKAGSR